MLYVEPENRRARRHDAAVLARFGSFGGGRYDGALLKSAAGFSLGLERLLAATEQTPQRDAAVTMLAATINAWNRIAISFRSIHPVKPVKATA